MTERKLYLSVLLALVAGIFSWALNAAGADESIINGETISPDFPYESRYVEVLGSRMHYVEEGEGEPVLFIHGNPTSSYLWRNVIPHVSGNYRAIAVDLIGMGKSDKPDIDYTYLDHRRYINGFIEVLGLENITFVIHDWGTVLGLDYAMNHEDNVAGVAFMEALIPPRFPVVTEPPANTLFGRFRTEGEGEKLIVEDNYFVEQLLPGAVIRELRAEEMDYYRSPYLNPASRKPVLQWPRELPMGGTPAANVKIISDIGEWMQQTDVPMLHFWSQGQEDTARYYVDNLRDIESHFLGEARHYVQEDHPETIGRAVNDWRRRIEAR